MQLSRNIGAGDLSSAIGRVKDAEERRRLNLVGRSFEVVDEVVNYLLVNKVYLFAYGLFFTLLDSGFSAVRGGGLSSISPVGEAIFGVHCSLALTAAVAGCLVGGKAGGSIGAVAGAIGGAAAEGKALSMLLGADVPQSLAAAGTLAGFIVLCRSLQSDFVESSKKMYNLYKEFSKSPIIEQ